MYPLVLSDEVVSTFSFWYGGEARQGISSGRELYGFYKKFSAVNRQEAFSTAVDLTETGVEVCLTCSPTEYKVWVSLRNLEQVALCFLPSTPTEAAVTA